MRIIKRSHQHIKHETLSEYLDGRLQGSALARVDQQLTACQLCREELESLRSTITMLQELPQEAPRRSFVMTAPPPMPARATSSASQFPNFLRVPQWAYAGAASVAVIVFVALISADATGLLSPGGASQFQGQPTAITQQLESQAAAPVAAQAPPEDTAPQQTTAPAATAAPAAPEQSLAAAPVQEFQAQDSDEEATSERAAAPVASAAEEPPERTAAAAPAEEPSPEEAAGDLGPSGGPGPVPGDAAAELETPLIAPPEVEKVPAVAPVPTGVPQAPGEGTAVVWRVLEGVAAFFGLIFLVALGFKWRLSGKTGVG